MYSHTEEKLESCTIPVRLALSIQMLSKFMRCEPDEEVYEPAKGSSIFSECMIGQDMPPELGYKGAVLIKGRAFFVLDYGGREVNKKIKVRRNTNGL